VVVPADLVDVELRGGELGLDELLAEEDRLRGFASVRCSKKQ
jgi:hypothetical protein